ncbi:hypothetical protein [Pseudonocardia sp. GCM10023141]|uniref:hypothetical protein n=1 Tax=Pseudonocardia sp. GCM10023141 TaxID=3252653 RepID=UPI003605AC67
MDSNPAHDISIYYSPFEYVAPSPRLILLGITPGSEQAKRANQALWQELRQGTSDTDSLRLAKIAGTFEGEPLRSNLLEQIADWQIHEWLGFESPEDVLSGGPEQGVVHLTSALRYPTFKSGKGYSGASPKILGDSVLRSHFVDHLCSETPQWGDALIFPLGKEPAAVASALAARGAIRHENIHTGLINPSQNNSYRLKWILGDRTEKRPSLTDPASYDLGRDHFRRMHLEP